MIWKEVFEQPQNLIRRARQQFELIGIFYAIWWTKPDTRTSVYLGRQTLGLQNLWKQWFKEEMWIELKDAFKQPPRTHWWDQSNRLLLARKPTTVVWKLKMAAIVRRHNELFEHHTGQKDNDDYYSQRKNDREIEEYIERKIEEFDSVSYSATGGDIKSLSETQSFKQKQIRMSQLIGQTERIWQTISFKKGNWLRRWDGVIE